jgi:hypothetical protein
MGITGSIVRHHLSVLAAVLVVGANPLAVAGDGVAPGTQFTPLAASVLTDPTPFRFNRFDLVGQVTERIWDDNIGPQPTGLLPFAPAGQPGRRRREMPLDRNVRSFPAAR